MADLEVRALRPFQTVVAGVATEHTPGEEFTLHEACATALLPTLGNKLELVEPPPACLTEAEWKAEAAAQEAARQAAEEAAQGG